MAFSTTFDAHIQEAILISEKDCATVTVPAGIAAQEAANLKIWATADKLALEAVGLDWTIVDSLTDKAGFLMDAESRWAARRFEKAEARKKWLEVSPAVFVLRDDLVHSFYYAYRNNKEILARVQEVAEGTTDADMILDLNTINHIGKNNPDELNAIRFDMKLLDTAAETAQQMQELLAQANGTSPVYNEARLVRDQAYTMLKKSVDDVRECGQHVFYRNAARFPGYCSNYLRTHRTKRKSSTEPSVPSSTTTTPPN
ncbi:MAG TPA: hypothetical protein VKO63_10615 [Chitinispirillaceae bacterium]|nr:hypothetical protein [Chitinispirillaceae bacterium]